jgi:hypothetical protein
VQGQPYASTPLIYKDFFALSKISAAPHQDQVFVAKRWLSTIAGQKATDHFQLSPTAVHFCTFCVDKIVSKAQAANSSH